MTLKLLQELMCELDSGAIVGYSVAGRQRDQAVPFSSELYGLYLCPHLKGQGLGSGLVRSAVEWLVAQGHENLIVWVIEKNSIGRKFYLSVGGTHLPNRRTKEFNNMAIVEFAYGWSNLKSLLSQLSAELR